MFSWVSDNIELHLLFIQNTKFFPWAYLKHRRFAKDLSFDKSERVVNRMASSFYFYFYYNGEKRCQVHTFYFGTKEFLSLLLKSPVAFEKS